MSKRFERVLETQGHIVLADERRGAARRREQATIEIKLDSSGYKTVPLIEYTRLGARVVMAQADAGQALDVVICEGQRTVHGLGRIAWASPLSNGRCVAGIEMVRFTSVLGHAV